MLCMNIYVDCLCAPKCSCSLHAQKNRIRRPIRFIGELLLLDRALQRLAYFEHPPHRRKRKLYLRYAEQLIDAGYTQSLIYIMRYTWEQLAIHRAN